MTNLISITEVIKLANAKNISLGNGDPEEHIFYLAKLGLVPKAVRRKSGGKLEGHYDSSIIDRLEKITQMKKQGMTYSQMKFHFGQLPSLESLNPAPLFFEQNQQSRPQYLSPATIFLILGIVLGFLLSNRLENSTSADQYSLVPSQYLNLSSVNSSAQDQATINLLRSKLSAIDNDSQSIYVISVPKSNFSNLDKVNLNF